MTDATKHMPTDPTAHALTEGGKAAGRMPPNPITIRVKDLADATPIIAKLKADGVDELTHVKIHEHRFDTLLAGGRLKDLA
jgi:hypothetical protein